MMRGICILYYLFHYRVTGGGGGSDGSGDNQDDSLCVDRTKKSR